MAHLIKRHQEARDALIKGINELADTVTITLGPKGHNVAIDKRWSAPNVVHDGATVAKAITLKDPFENMGAEMLKEAATKTADLAGDGTTTATLLAQAIINAGNEEIKKGANGMTLQKGINKAVTIIVDEIKKSAKKLNTKEETAAIATISAANADLGKIIADAIEHVGKRGVVAVEAGVKNTTEVTYKEGMEFDHGYQSAAFVTNKDRMICEIEKPYILFADFSIAAADEVATFLETFMKTTQSKDIVFITDGIEGNALTTLIMNSKAARGAINVCAVQAPGIGVKRQELLEDMAILTGGAAAFKENGINITNVPLEALGRADKVEINAETCKIIGGAGADKDIKRRVAIIETQLAKATSEFEKDKLNERLAKLTGGVAIIQIGGETDLQINETKERAIDAVSATKAATEEGIVAGGGVTYLKAREAIKPITAKGDEALGMTIVYDALEQPMLKLLENGGLTLKGKEIDLDGETGFDVETGDQVNMFEKGIIDPAKVTRLALEKAASIAGMILTTEGIITEIPEDKQSPMERMQMPMM